MTEPVVTPVKRVPIILTMDESGGRERQLAPKISPKLIEFARWEYIDEVNTQLDSGKPCSHVHTWVKEHGFSISHVWLGEYAKLRKKALVDGVSMEHILGIIGKPVFDPKDLANKSTKEKLKSEIDALDLLIQGGYNTLLQHRDRPVAPKLMMEAIRLKNELTDGNHGFLTNYGMEHLRNIENAKFGLVINHLISYIPEDKRDEALSKISEIEDKYYQTTDYYEEYLRASGDFTENEIERKLKAWRNSSRELEVDGRESIKHAEQQHKAAMQNAVK